MGERSATHHFVAPARLCLCIAGECRLYRAALARASVGRRDGWRFAYPSCGATDQWGCRDDVPGCAITFRHEGRAFRPCGLDWANVTAVTIWPVAAKL